MADEPSLGEIGRAIVRIEQQLDHLVSVKVYEANRDADRQMLARLDADLRAERTEREKLEERRTSDRRWTVTAIVLPIAGMLLQLYMASRGAP